MYSDLKNKTAIITGSSSGIGSSVKKLFLKNGVKVIDVDLPEYDFSNIKLLEKEIKKLLDEISGQVDILVNNAGYTHIGSIEETEIEEMQKLFNINFFAPLILVKHIIPYMKYRKSGSIVNVSSDQAFIGKKYSAVYGSSKAALAQFTKSAALDYGKYNIRFNSVAPGSTDTKMLRDVIKQLGEKYPEDYPSDSESFYKDSIPLKRFAKPDEIANLIVFLSSDASSFITGSVIPIDGGFTAQ